MQFSFFKRIADDLKIKKLIPIKILFFVNLSTLLVLYPYLTIHMRELGINVEETAIMSAVTPVFSIIMPPLGGMIADKIGNFKLLLAISSVLGGVSALLLPAVPVGRLTLTFPPALELIGACNGGRIALSHVYPYPCTSMEQQQSTLDLSILSCGFVCNLPQDLSQEETVEMFKLETYDVHLYSDLNNSKPVIYTNSMSPFLPLNTSPQTDQTASRILRNDPNFPISVSQLTNNRAFFPSLNLYKIDCINTSSGTCVFGYENSPIEDQSEDSIYKMLVTNMNDGNETDYWVNSIAFGNSTSKEMLATDEDNLTCKDTFGQVHVHVGGRRLGGCSAACAASVPRSQLCRNKKQTIELDPVFTFWAYLAVRVFIGIIGGTAFAMFEGAVIAILREHDADYGLQRVYGSVGGMISAPLSGLLIDYASRGKGYTDFRPAFYLYAILKVLSAGLMLTIDLEFKKPAQNLLKDVATVFKNIEIVALFMACFVMGTAWGYIESFLFWLLKDLDASSSLMGFTVTVGGVAGLPLLVLSGPIINKLGHANVIFIGFIFYAIRLLGYSLLENPWLCLPYEALESVTSSLTVTACVTFAATLSAPTTDTAVQGMLGGLYYGVGKGAGSLIGGYLMKAVGTRQTYQIFSAATLFTGCLYFIFNQFYIRKRVAKTAVDDDLCKKKTALDIECVDTAKVKSALDGVDTKLSVKERPSGAEPSDCSDGADSGDSGVDNPAYCDTETSPEHQTPTSKTEK